MEANIILAILLLIDWQTQYTYQLLHIAHYLRHILSTCSDFSSRLWDAILLPYELDPIEEVFWLANMTFLGLLLPESNPEDV
jgi:hypothetical protein